jgi:hypothetical protein
MGCCVLAVGLLEQIIGCCVLAVGLFEQIIVVKCSLSACLSKLRRWELTVGLLEQITALGARCRLV